MKKYVGVRDNYAAAGEPSLHVAEELDGKWPKTLCGRPAAGMTNTGQSPAAVVASDKHGECFDAWVAINDAAEDEVISYAD